MAGENNIPTPPDATEVKASQPANPSRRKWGIAALATLAGAIGFKKASETPSGQKIIQSASETGQRILKTAPGQDYSDTRPSIYQQQTEVLDQLKRQDPELNPKPTLDPVESKIRATMDAGDNRYKTPTPTPPSKK